MAEHPLHNIKRPCDTPPGMPRDDAEGELHGGNVPAGVLIVWLLHVPEIRTAKFARGRPEIYQSAPEFSKAIPMCCLDFENGVEGVHNVAVSQIHVANRGSSYPKSHAEMPRACCDNAVLGIWASAWGQWESRPGLAWSAVCPSTVAQPI